MPGTVDFYYGLGSRYSYIAAGRIPWLESATGAHINWIPINSHRLITYNRPSPFSHDPFDGQYNWAYRQRDAEDLATLYGLPFLEPVGRFDVLSGKMKRDEVLAFYDMHVLAARAAGRQGGVREMSDRLFRMNFVDDRTEISYVDIIGEAVELGLDMEKFYRDLVDPSLRVEHDESVKDAAVRGAFGVPTFFVNNRMFWGQDRMNLVEAALNGQI